MLGGVSGKYRLISYKEPKGKAAHRGGCKPGVKTCAQARAGRDRPLSRTMRTKVARVILQKTRREGRQNRPLEKGFSTPPQGRSQAGLPLPGPELNLRGQRPPACSNVLYLSDLTSVIQSVTEQRQLP